MEPSSSSSSSSSKVEEWEDFEQALARLWSLSSAVNQPSLRKLSLQHKLQSHIQEANVSLAGERGCTRFKNLQKLLRLRQQYMVSQVSLIYPVKVVVGHTCEQELESFTSARDPSGLKPPDQGSLTISGLHLSLLPFTKMSFFTNKKEVQRSATALGYVAHAVSLVASYLEVPLRYPLRMGGSRSYIRDYAPSIESTAADSASSVPFSSNSKPIEFPLFLEGQDTTRAAYAVFLLNKI